MQPIIACFLLMLVSATVVYGNGHGDWSQYTMPGCEDYAKALMQRAYDTGAMDEMKKCNDEPKEKIRECLWNIGMELVNGCDTEPTEDCLESVRKVFKMD